jgi:hypothetical protein
MSMSMPSGRTWADALRQTLKRVCDPTTRVPVPWLLAGDAALFLQGVSVEPEVLEFRAISPFAAAYFAQLMKLYEAPDTAATIVYRLGGNTAPSTLWRSNVHQRIVAWSHAGRATWLGRWPIGDITVQVSYVRSVQPDPIGLCLKATSHKVRWEGMDVAVVPLEYGLAEAALRADSERTQRIMHALRTTGYHAEELRRALAPLPLEKASRIMRSLEFTIL